MSWEIVTFKQVINHIQGLHRWFSGKESTCNGGDPGSIPGSGRSPGEETATHSSILAWEIPWTEEPGRLQAMGSQRVRYNWATEHTQTLTMSSIFISVPVGRVGGCWALCLWEHFPAHMYGGNKNWAPSGCLLSSQWNSSWVFFPAFPANGSSFGLWLQIHENKFVLFNIAFNYQNQIYIKGLKHFWQILIFNQRKYYLLLCLRKLYLFINALH